MKKIVLALVLVLLLSGSYTYSHQIDNIEDKCMANATSSEDMVKCTITAQESWQKEIDTNLNHLKALLDKKEYKNVEKSQKSWEKFKKNEFELIEKVTGKTNSVFVYESLKKDILKERAFALLGYTQVILDSKDN